ncbi:DNA-binding transcriptional LysR family regulator [Amorphus sp. MBR-141]
MQDTHLEVRGVLRVAGPRTLGEGPIMAAIMAFVRDSSQIKLDLHLEDRFVDLVEEGFDVAVRVSELADSSLIARRLAPLRMVVAASPGRIAASGRPLQPGELSDLPCVIDSNARWRANWGFVVDGVRQTVPVKGRVEANSPTAVKMAALEGIGYAMLPYAVAREEILSGALEVVLDDFACDGAAIYAVYPHRRHLSAKVRTFVDHLAAWFAEPANLEAIGG